jgi:hypothetical protein
MSNDYSKLIQEIKESKMDKYVRKTYFNLPKTGIGRRVLIEMLKDEDDMV